MSDEKDPIREPGYYFVRFSNLSEWEIAKWVPNHGWSMFWTDQYLSKLYKVDERRIVREEVRTINAIAEPVITDDADLKTVEHWGGFSGNTERTPQNE